MSDQAQPPKQTQPTGPQLRDEGVAIALAADTAAHRGLRTEIERILDKLISAGGEFTADTVREQLPADVRERLPRSLLGAVMRLASQQGRIRYAGWDISSRAVRHAGAVRRWVGAYTSTSFADQRHQEAS